MQRQQWPVQSRVIYHCPWNHKPLSCILDLTETLKIFLLVRYMIVTLVIAASSYFNDVTSLPQDPPTQYRGN